MMASEAEFDAAYRAYLIARERDLLDGRDCVRAALEAAERVRAAEMAKLEKSLTSLIREDRPE